MATDDTVCLYYGCWKIVDFVSMDGSVEAMGIEGTEFHLYDSGDVLWKVSKEGIEQMPFFSSETFEIFYGTQPTLKLFGSDAGHIIEFKMELSGDLLLLSYDNWFMLQCQRVSHDPKNDVHFSFMNALEEGYFSDLSLVADTGKEFKVHKTILSLSVPQLDWNQNPPPLSNFPEDVLTVALHYLYSACLPATITEDTAKRCIQAMEKSPGFSHLSELCEMFLKSTALKQQIITLVNDMHTCAGRIIDYFSGKPVEGGGNSPSHGTGASNGGTGTGDSLTTNPAKLCYIMKQSLRECAIAGAKLLIVCDLFARRKNELSRIERHEIIKYAKSRLPIFMQQLHKFLEVTRQTFSDMPMTQRQDIAQYLVPQIETAFETMSHLYVETKTALDQIINSSNSTSKTPNSDRSGKKPVKEVLGKSFRHILHMRELVKLRNFNEKITLSFMNMMQKKTNFTNMTSANKLRTVTKNLEQVIEEIPMFMVRLEGLMAALDDKLTWKDWKYTYKLGTSKVAWMLQKLVAHRPTLRSMISRITDMVHRDQFAQSMILLGLLDPPPDQDSPPSSSTPTTPPKPNPPSQPTSMMNTLESLSIPPLASDSNLAKNAVQFLKSEQRTDMVFEIVCVEDVSDTVIDHTRGEPVGHTTQEQEVEVHHIQAHCVIIASRCDWFRRALLSGMRESIDKKIIVHDTNPALFKVFLEYLYGGTLDTSNLSTDQLADLMLLSDRYEVDSLKQLCESTLKSGISHDSALFLLSMADQFNAKTLKAAALEFVIENPDISESEIFYELPDDLRTEVEDRLSWPRSKRQETCSRRPQKVDGIRYHGCCPFGSLEEVEPLETTLEDAPLTQDSAQLEACVAQLRDIVGESVPHDELVSVSLAADYDVNRAVNFFFS